MDFPLKSARIANFCNILSGFADFENTADRGLAENFGRILDSICQEVQIVDTKTKFGSL